MGNPRNTGTAVVEGNGAEVKQIDPSSWKTLTLGSLSNKGNDGKLLREGAISFTINSRNAEIFRDAAQYVLDNQEEKVTISAGTFYEDANVSDKVRKFFSHRLYISAETIGKMGKAVADYVQKKTA